MAAASTQKKAGRVLARADTGATRSELRTALHSMKPAERLGAYHRGELTFQQVYLWAASYPDEVPLVDGEFEFIALSMADLD